MKNITLALVLGMFSFAMNSAQASVAGPEAFANAQNESTTQNLNCVAAGTDEATNVFTCAAEDDAATMDLDRPFPGGPHGPGPRPFPPGPGPRPGSVELECASDGGAQARCEVRGFIDHANIAAQESHDACNFGSDWGWEANFIWVNHGCRARFHVVFR
jgi:hypothetical protein